MPDIPIGPGVVADVAVLIQSVAADGLTASVRVIDNNNGFITGAVSLPVGVVRPKAFAVSIGDVLEETADAHRTAVVRWVNGTGQWSESPSGIPGRDTVGWKRIGSFNLP